jgi:hypothetical protein
MASILLFRDDERSIDEARFLEALACMSGVSDTKRSGLHGARVRCNYATREDSVVVELADNLKAVDISDMGPAALDFAVRLQARLEEPLRIIDEGYNFDLQLKAFRTPAELDAGIDAAMQQEE